MRTQGGFIKSAITEICNSQKISWKWMIPQLVRWDVIVKLIYHSVDLCVVLCYKHIQKSTQRARLVRGTWNSPVKVEAVQPIVHCVMSDIFWKCHENLFTRLVSLMLLTGTDPANKNESWTQAVKCYIGNIADCSLCHIQTILKI